MKIIIVGAAGTSKYGESSVNNHLDRKMPAMVSFVLAAFSLVLSPAFARAIQLL
jgi:hypothetical protein